MYEHRHQPLIPFRIFLRRILHNVFIAGAVAATALGIGILGYRFTENLPWIDALLNASMILGGMGPVSELHTTAGKLFASWYALFSGVVFITSAGILVAPLLHRFLHHFHLEEK
jgi:hypothetical protein